jgi:hypothetical protein
LLNLPAVLTVSLLVDLLLIAIGRSGVGMPMGDLFFAYQSWAHQVFKDGVLFGVSTPWVYPWPALIPIALSNLITPDQLWIAWLALVTIAQALVVWFTVTRNDSPRRYLATYAWLGFNLALGPVAISRVDTFSVQLALVGVFLVVANRRQPAAAFLTIAAWIKIWPIALFSPLAFSRERVWRTLGIGAAVSAGFVLIALLAGGNLLSIFSFATGQGSRGIQIESPFALPWLWAGALGDSSSGIVYNQALMTFEVYGPSTQLIASLLNLVQLGAVLITLTLIYLASKKIAFDEKHALSGEVMTWGSFTFVLDLIVFNKVGSPQYISWLAVPIIFGILVSASRINVGAILTFTTTALTWWIYPFAYDGLLADHASAVLLLTVRNCLEVVLLVYANVRITQLATKQL